jgi:hypothetical protein
VLKKQIKGSYLMSRIIPAIEKVHREFSDPAHPVNIAMAKMQDIPEIRIIEGKDN